jgi:hypothetical protein
VWHLTLGYVPDYINQVIVKRRKEMKERKRPGETTVGHEVEGPWDLASGFENWKPNAGLERRKELGLPPNPSPRNEVEGPWRHASGFENWRRADIIERRMVEEKKKKKEEESEDVKKDAQEFRK